LVQDKQEIEETMQMLKKQFVYIKKNQITKVKELISSYGAMYFEAEGEADSLCAQLVIENKVWACLSEDMDMFVYGANRVLRYLSLINHTVVLYDTEKLLNELDITQQELREICVLSGNDYSDVEDGYENKLKKVLKLFKKYCLVEQTQKDNHYEKYGFYEWLMKIKNDLIQDWESLIKITKIFEIDQEIENNLTTVSNYMENFNGKMDKPLMQYILSEDGFIFP
jgi:5'-3' exonuclease